MERFLCKWCGKEFQDYKCRKEWRKTCSRSCQIKLANTGRKKSKLWERIDLFIEEYLNGKTFKEIGEKYKINDTSILSRIFDKIEIKKRNVGTRKGKIPWNKGKESFYLKGDKNPNWKGGITSLIRLIRACRKYGDWKKQCLYRDKWICQICKKKNNILHIDHYPVMFSEIIRKYKIDSYQKAIYCKELWDINNGRTLCGDCHNYITANQRKNLFK